MKQTGDENIAADNPTSISTVRRTKILWLLLWLLTMLCLYQFYQNPKYLSSPVKSQKNERLPLADKINPNTASAASLTRLPGIGLTRANDIVTYRDKLVQDHDKNQLPFSSSEDLSKIKGIGPKTCNQIKEYLIFDKP
jgi:competence protein ComEA